VETAPRPSCEASAAQAQDAVVKPAVGLCFTLVVLKGNKTISRLSELAEVLSQRWPANRKGPAYVAALKTAHAAYLGSDFA